MKEKYYPSLILVIKSEWSDRIWIRPFSKYGSGYETLYNSIDIKPWITNSVLLYLLQYIG